MIFLNQARAAIQPADAPKYGRIPMLFRRWVHTASKVIQIQSCVLLLPIVLDIYLQSSEKTCKGVTLKVCPAGLILCSQISSTSTVSSFSCRWLHHAYIQIWVNVSKWIFLRQLSFRILPTQAFEHAVLALNHTNCRRLTNVWYRLASFKNYLRRSWPGNSGALKAQH